MPELATLLLSQVEKLAEKAEKSNDTELIALVTEHAKTLHEFFEPIITLLTNFPLNSPENWTVWKNEQ